MQSLLAKFSRLAAKSASVSLKARRSPLEALQSLEKARGIIAGFTIDAKLDISSLKEHHSELWTQYTHCQTQIADLDAESLSAVQNGPSEIYTAKSIQGQQLYDNLRDLREEIRNCPGFERFLLAASETELGQLAQPGPIVWRPRHTIAQSTGRKDSKTGYAVRLVPESFVAVTAH